MAEDSGRDALLAALKVRRVARLAVGVGGAITVGVTVFFLGLVAGGRTQAPLWYYPSLAFVVFATAAMLAAAVIVGRRVLRLAVRPAAVVRRAATGGLVAGLLWLAAAAGLTLGPGRPAFVEVTLPWAALLTPLGLWSVHARYKRVVRWQPVFAGAAVVGLLGALIVADLAAFDLVGLLGETRRGFDPNVVGIFGVGAAGLLGGQAVIAALASFGLPSEPADPVVPAVLGTPALVGLLAWELLGPGRLGLASLAAGSGIAWTGACWMLRRVGDTDVPAGPDPWA